MSDPVGAGVFGRKRRLVNDKTELGRLVRAGAQIPVSGCAERLSVLGQRSRNLKLGQVHVADVDDDLAVATVVAQTGYGPSMKTRVCFASLR